MNPPDVDQSVADADHAEQHDRRRLLRNDADQDQRRPEQRYADAEPGGEPASSDQPECEERPEQPTRSDGRVQDADARISGIQEIDGDHHRKHGQAAPRERLHNSESRNQCEPAIARDRGESRQDPATGVRGGRFRSRRRVIRKPHDQQAGQQRHGGARREDGFRSAYREQDSRGSRAAERGERVQHASNRVRTRQLRGRCAQPREQGRVRRPVQRLRDRGEDGQAIRRRRRAAGGGDHRSASQRRGADKTDACENPLTAHTIGHGRKQRRQHRRRNHSGAGDDADRHNPTVAESQNAQPDHEGALARPHRTERELSATERSALRNLCKRVGRGADPRRETTHHGATIPNRRRI